jgi:hypothetical protein
MGLIVDAVIDIVEERLAIEPENGRPGILGSAVIKGQAAEILDLGHFLSLACPDAGNCRERAGRNLLPRVLAAPNERAVA